MTTDHESRQADEFLTFGKHKGERWTRVPKSYLRWLINAGTQWADIAKEEMARRGTTVSHEIELSAHAIDRASLRCAEIWKDTRTSDDEGLYSWLERMAKEALASAEEGAEEVVYHGIKFCFSHGDYYPCLKSVFPK